MLDKTRLGTAMWNRIKADAAPYVPGIGGVQDAVGLKIWIGIADEIIKEFDTMADIKLLAADIKVDIGSFNYLGDPIAGVGEIQAVTLTGKIE